MLSQDGVQLACEVGAKALEGSIVNDRPFTVGARRDDQPASGALIRAEDLRFLTAHHIMAFSGILYGEAAHNPCITAQRLDPNETGTHLIQTCRTLYIRHLAPSLTAADH